MAPTSISIVLELDPELDVPVGTARLADGTSRTFHGWLGLTEAIDALAAIGGAAEASSPRTTEQPAPGRDIEGRNMHGQLRRTLVVGLLATAAAGLTPAPEPASAAWPGTNGSIVFSSHRDDQAPVVSGDIYVMAADGSGQTRLTNNGLARDIDPVFSPDGQRIAWASTQADADLEVFVMNADGSGATQVSDGLSTNASPAWSPDGQRIAFVSHRDGDYEIFVMDADGTDLTQLTHNTRWDDAPAWSPDGQRIVFHGAAFGEDFEVFVMDADGTDVTQLTDNDADDVEPAWSPDGQHIAFGTNQLGGADVFVMDADGTGQFDLTANPSAESEPFWSPDGQRIGFTTDYGEFGNPDVYLVNADGSGAPERLTTDAAVDRHGDWQPLGGAVDDVPPTVTCDGPVPAYVLGGSHDADVTATATDAGSDPSTWTVSADVSAADVATVGVKSVSLTTTDDAGNQTTVSCSFVVQYAFGGFLAPLPQQKNKAGSTIPVKFTLGEASGTTIPDTDAQALVGEPCRIRVTFAGGTQPGCPGYGAVTNVFKYDLKTTKGMPKGTHTITVEIWAPDGSGLLQIQAIEISIL